ncbi:MAG: signal peptidase I [Actinomycetota bacterium]|nr:MAG: signal peptidase endoplasmic [Actinomycetota bacterium]MDP3630462.1 signal peptidase I [Actinomycetota bacterium]
MIRGVVRVASVATTVLLVVALLALLFVSISPLLAGRNPSRPTFFGGLAPMVVLSGSMQPTYDIGSILFIEQINPADVAVGDVITYQSPVSPGSPPSLTTHRVTAIDTESGRLAFRTQGDANNVEDTWVVPADTVVGRGSFSIPYLGYASSFIRSKTGFLMLVIIPAVLIVLLELSSIIKTIRERRDAKQTSSGQGLSAEETP